MTTPTKPLRLTPPQIHALRLLRDGWQCASGSVTPERFGHLLWYPFTCQGQKTQYAAGTTLTSLQWRGWMTWEPATLTCTADSSTYNGYRLVLTETGQQVADTL